jgi:peptidyl-prolyl cis-trans isomerase A (cyclophilin A)
MTVGGAHLGWNDSTFADRRNKSASRISSQDDTGPRRLTQPTPATRIQAVKTFSSAALASVCFVYGFSAVYADDLTPPVVKSPVRALVVPSSKKRSVVQLTDTFGLKGVSGEVVRFETTLGDMDLELQQAIYPKNVANFLKYVNSGKYNGTIIHRGYAGFIFQGGGFYVAGNLDYPPIEANPATVEGEHQGSNVRGTIAIALMGGTNSADTGTDEWFFNLADNTNLDTYASNQGPFTAFGHIIENGLATMDKIGTVPTYDASGIVTPANSAPAFNMLPLENYQSSQGEDINPDLVLVNKVALIPMVPANPGGEALLTLSATSAKPELVMAKVTGHKLVLTYPSHMSGSTRITVKAKDSAGTMAKTVFKVTVQEQ